MPLCRTLPSGAKRLLDGILEHGVIRNRVGGEAVDHPAGAVDEELLEVPQDVGFIVRLEAVARLLGAEVAAWLFAGMRLGLDQAKAGKSDE